MALQRPARRARRHHRLVRVREPGVRGTHRRRSPACWSSGRSAFSSSVLRIDDPVGAFAVHGACGTWGALALGLLADGSSGAGVNGVAGPVRGLLFGDAGQFAAQLIGVGANILFVFGTAYGSSD